jgi:LEA14-like dessication related protein
MCSTLKNKILSRSINSLFIVLSLTLFSSCGDLERIEIGDPQEVKIQGFDGNYLKILAQIPINNPSAYNVKIQEIDLRVYLNGTYIGKLIVDEAIEIERKVNKNYELPVKIRLNNILGAAYIMMNMKQGQKVEIRLEGLVTAKTIMFTREFQIDQTKKIVL